MIYNYVGACFVYSSYLLLLQLSGVFRRMDCKDIKEEAEDDTILFIAIATTGLFRENFDPEICQITLAKEDGTKLFARHVLPEGKFQKEATQFNGFSIGDDNGKRFMMRRGKKIKTYALETVMNEFIEELASIRAQVCGRIVLLGYNSEAFDIKVLMKEMARCGLSGKLTRMSASMNIVCADLFKLLSNNHSKVFRYRPYNFRMTTIYNELSGTSECHMHDALEDVYKLRCIYSAIVDLVEKKTFEKYFFSFSSVAVMIKHAN